MKRKFRWIDLALLPFGLCVLFLLLLGKLFGLTYKQISVVFNLWVQGVVLALSGLAPFGIAIYKLLESFSMGWLLLTIILQYMEWLMYMVSLKCYNIITCHSTMRLTFV